MRGIVDRGRTSSMSKCGELMLLIGERLNICEIHGRWGAIDRGYICITISE